MCRADNRFPVGLGFFSRSRRCRVVCVNRRRRTLVGRIVRDVPSRNSGHLVILRSRDRTTGVAVSSMTTCYLMGRSNTIDCCVEG